MRFGRMRALVALLGAVAAATVEEPRAEPQTGGRVARYDNLFSPVNSCICYIFKLQCWLAESVIFLFMA